MSKEAKLRLALRVEGRWWVAYLAEVGTMDGAVEMGRILMDIVAEPIRKKEFMDTMTGAMLALVRSTGAQPTGQVVVRAAPERERSGRA